MRPLRLLWLSLYLLLPLPLFAADTLLDAARDQDAAAATRLLKEGADVRQRADDGTTALHWAAYNGDEALAQALIKAGADVDARNDYGSSPLQEAAERGNTAIIRALLKARVDVESANPEGQTALMTVARTGNLEAAKLLLKAGAKVDAVERWRGQTALMWAAAQSQPAMVRLLVKSGARVDARSNVREWARRVTAEPRPQNRPLGGFTALLLAAREGCADCARELVKGGADINLQDPDNITPLLMATLNARFDVAVWLIEAGADVNRWDTWGRAPLYSAIDYNTTPRGGRPDRPSTDRATALEVAALLLARGANPNMQLKLFPPYRSLGQDRGGDSMLTVGTTPLIRAAKSGDVPAVKLLLARGALPDLANQLGITPLMAAAGVGSTTIDIRGRFRNEAPCIEVSQLLVAAGARVDAQRDNGQTALHGAAQWGWNDYVRFLAKTGAKLAVKDRSGATPLDIATGKVGGTGRAGVAGAEAHEDTAKLLRELMAAPQTAAAGT
jgi:ankyrin repeat protein